MPKQRISKEMVVDAAFELARSGGMEQVMLKNIADRLGCSVQPIYSYCNNMDGLRQEIIERTDLFIKEYLIAHIDTADFFRSTGHSYIQLAKEEPHIFQIFVMHKRYDVSSLDDLYHKETNPNIAKLIAKELNISISKAKTLHMNMLIYTMGIGTILATTTPGIATEEIYNQLEIAHDAFLQQVLKNK